MEVVGVCQGWRPWVAQEATLAPGGVGILVGLSLLPSLLRLLLLLPHPQTTCLLQRDQGEAADNRLLLLLDPLPAPACSGSGHWPCCRCCACCCPCPPPPLPLPPQLPGPTRRHPRPLLPAPVCLPLPPWLPCCPRAA